MLKFHPKAGTILICDYSPGFKVPEMVKRRLVVVVSPRLRRRHGLCSVVPLSTTEPNPTEAWHYPLQFERSFPKPFSAQDCWEKCDMLATVGFHRLSLIRAGTDVVTGKRRYLQPCLGLQDLDGIRKSVLAGLGIGFS